ncbi:MAG: ATP-binding protein [Clostridiales bacterium]|uniref:ATP-binding protein n=1 Tax=Terrisporobacter sp. TaxID=1965305 RepID=UPI002A51335F|nr:ATP-binding protein [Terrisporobacter sp.]MDD7754526.1 ATP-binding protein [Clostridiales bacterium]MDY4135944.1 ATP-binding protein [Terrisporobacter sp.]
MAIDILNIQPSVISRDLKGKFVCIYSLPKVGKTSMACQFPKNLLLGFEHGWNAIGGVKAIDVTKWADFKLILRQLEKPEAKAMYDTITIDTIGIAWDACEQYICAQNGVQKISDIPWGGGYSACKKEFESCLRKITQLGYGLVIIAHVERRIEKRADDSEVEILGPAIPKRAYEIVNQLVDIIGYIDVSWDEEGNTERWLYTRKTPTVMAGSRFKYLAPKIKFGYQELVDAIAEAIEKSEKIDGAKVVDKQENIIEETLSFNEVRNEAMELWNKLIELDPENSKIILKKVEMVFGRTMKLSEITEDQVDLFNLVVLDMRDLLKEQTN